jgi:hypothetical protein
MFQKQIAYGSKEFSWSISGKIYNYSRGICSDEDGSLGAQNGWWFI